MKMSCRQFIELLDDFMEATMQAENSQRCEAHLAECPYCRDYLKTYRDTVNLMKKALCREPQAEVPAELAEELVKAVRRVRESS